MKHTLPSYNQETVVGDAKFDIFNKDSEHTAACTGVRFSPLINPTGNLKRPRQRVRNRKSSRRQIITRKAVIGRDVVCIKTAAADRKSSADKNTIGSLDSDGSER